MTDEVPTEGKVQVLGELSILLYMGFGKHGLVNGENRIVTYDHEYS